MSQQKRVQSCAGGDDQEGFELSASDDSEPEEELSRAPFDQELDDSDDGGVEVCAPGSSPSPASAFILSGGNPAFSNRSRSIFDCLDSVERKSAPPLTEESSPPPPQCPPPTKKRGVPDYLLHPERWTRYSLEDVKETTEQENRQAAHNFLSGLRPEDGNRPPGEPPHDHQQKMIFSKPKRPFTEDPPGSSSETLKEKRLHLSHLAEEEEEDKAAARTERGGDQQESLPSFTSFKKTKAKNYRRSWDQKDE